jgi:hypothetical protein
MNSLNLLLEPNKHKELNEHFIELPCSFSKEHDFYGFEDDQ